MGRHPTLIDVLFLIGVGSALVGLGLPSISSVAERRGGSPALVAGGLAVWVLAAAGFVYCWRGR
jgi:hypothetical protein